jgi:hypothetical protein
LRPCDAHQCSYPIFLLTLYRLAACLAGDFHVEVDRLELGDGSRGHFLNLWPPYVARQAFMGHRSIANTVVYTAVADKRIRNIWGK